MLDIDSKPTILKLLDGTLIGPMNESRPVFRNTFKSRLVARRAGTLLLLLTYGITSLGCPLPALKAKVGNVPFPCQDHPCGCRTPEECWQHCCCFTPEQHWAWAREHDVEPPSYAQRPEADADSTGEPTSLGHSDHSQANACPHCSADDSENPCCSAANAVQTEDRTFASKKTVNDKHEHDPHEGETRWQLGFAHGNCKGPSSASSLAVAPSVPVAIQRSNAELIPSFDQVCDALFLSFSVSYRPLTPPPRAIVSC
ncbi:MAG: hypothetical protein ACJ8FY_14325 [Gemmataceae bacterium]